MARRGTSQSVKSRINKVTGVSRRRVTTGNKFTTRAGKYREVRVAFGLSAG